VSRGKHGSYRFEHRFEEEQTNVRERPGGRVVGRLSPSHPDPPISGPQSSAASARAHVSIFFIIATSKQGGTVACLTAQACSLPSAMRTTGCPGCRSQSILAPLETRPPQNTFAPASTCLIAPLSTCAIATGARASTLTESVGL
jgi:hypothetical protein